jgi:trehalose 6-phosphate synthase/phosphatase
MLTKLPAYQTFVISQTPSNTSSTSSIGMDEKGNKLDEKVNRLDEKVNKLDEKVDRLDEKVEHVETNNVQSWTNNYIKRLLTNLESFDQSSATPALDPAKLLMQYRQARKRLFLFDYDGTLTAIVKDPQLAIPSDRIIHTIKTLASDPANQVWIISGRDQAFLEEWMGHISELGLSAEHGSFMRHPHSKIWENVVAEMDMSWQQEVMDIFQHFTDRTQGKIPPQLTLLICHIVR